MGYDLKTGEKQNPIRLPEVRYMKAVLAVSFAIPVLYLIYCCVLMWYDKTPDSAVTAGVFGFFGTEIFACAWIKNTETKNKGDE